jgi:hypothetical protein
MYIFFVASEFSLKITHSNFFPLLILIVQDWKMYFFFVFFLIIDVCLSIVSFVPCIGCYNFFCFAKRKE